MFKFYFAFANFSLEGFNSIFKLKEICDLLRYMSDLKATFSTINCNQYYPITPDSINYNTNILHFLL